MTVKTKRRTQEQRSTEAREFLSRAAFELIRELGYANFRVAGVCKRAGVSQGGQLHHFPTKGAMTMAAIEYAIAIAHDVTKRNLDSFEPGTDPIAAIIEDSKDYYFADSFTVIVDISRAVSHDEEMKNNIVDVLRSYRDYAEDSWLQRLTDAGWAANEARDLINMTTSVVRGFAVRAWLQPDKTEFYRLIQRWHDAAVQYFPAVSSDVVD